MEKSKFKKITLDDWEKAGEGGNAESFFHKKDKKKVLKLAFNKKACENKLFEEAEVAEQAIALGVNTPKVLAYVKYEDRYGLVYERLIGKKSFGKLCHDDPEHIEDYAKIFAKELAKLHKIKCNKIKLRDRKKEVLKIINQYKDEPLKEISVQYIKNMKDVNTIIHGDASLGNLLMVGKKTYWIDMGTMMCSDPIYDLGIIYLSYTFLIKLKYVQEVFHVNEKQANVFCEVLFDEYAKIVKKDKNELIRDAKKIAVVILYVMSNLKRYPFFVNMILRRKAKKWIKEVEKNA